jgi:predicted nucleic acid-binding protein
MIYADTSFFVALNVPRARQFKAALAFYEKRQDQVWYWSPWHRVEVFNTIRQMTRDDDPRLRLPEHEAKAIIYEIQQDVRLEYFQHVEVDWRDALRTANELSIAHGLSLKCRSADLLHVAYALEVAAALFLGFDSDQLALAKAAGIQTALPR